MLLVMLRLFLANQTTLLVAAWGLSQHHESYLYLHIACRSLRTAADYTSLFKDWVNS